MHSDDCSFVFEVCLLFSVDFCLIQDCFWMMVINVHKRFLSVVILVSEDLSAVGSVTGKHRVRSEFDRLV